MTKKKGSGKPAAIEFMAETEVELQEWLLPMKSIAGVSNCFRSSSPVKYVSSELRKTWLSQVNSEGDTPLHVLAKFKNRNNFGELVVPTGKILQLAMWLIDNGCPLDHQNRSKQTALHLAVRYANKEMARCFVAKGANISIPNGDNRKLVDVCTAEVYQEITNDIVGAAWQRAAALCLSGAKRLRGYSYLSLNFQKHSQSSSEHRYVVICHAMT